jgi:hypothetical protein
MSLRIVCFALGLGLLASPTLASEGPGAPDREPRATVSTRPSAPLDRTAIFEILCGGAAPEPGLSAHLWTVAGRLAERDWTPPRVTVRVVVSDIARR